MAPIRYTQKKGQILSSLLSVDRIIIISLPDTPKWLNINLLPAPQLSYIKGIRV